MRFISVTARKVALQFISTQVVKAWSSPASRRQLPARQWMNSLATVDSMGSEDFRDLTANKDCFVDKTLFISQFFYRTSKVSLLTYPRRFGKSSALSTLKRFFSLAVADEPTGNLFAKLKIAKKAPELIEQHQGQYLVVSISFKSVQFSSYAEAIIKIRELIKKLFAEHKTLLKLSTIDDYDRQDFQMYLTGSANNVQLSDSLKTLTEFLKKATGQRSIVLIDEYDAPILAGERYGYYEDIIIFFRGMYGAVLKGNDDYLYKGLITGVTRIARESLFSGVNNLTVHGMDSPAFAPFFGFSEQEVKSLLRRHKLTAKLPEVQRWYNGYNFGGLTVYNPWSIVHCLYKRGELKPYWVNTGDDSLIRELVLSGSARFREDFITLLQGGTVRKVINQQSTIAQARQEPQAAWGLMCLAGYLKMTPVAGYYDLFDLAVPNLEVTCCYQRMFTQWFTSDVEVMASPFIRHLLAGDMPAWQEELQAILVKVASIKDIKQPYENFYHTLVMAVVASVHLEPDYLIKSNRDSGDGYLDLMMVARDGSKLSIVMEFKRTTDPKQLEHEAEEALAQIENKHYLKEVYQAGAKEVLKVGLAFCGKDFALRERRVSPEAAPPLRRSPRAA